MITVHFPVISTFKPMKMAKTEFRNNFCRIVDKYALMLILCSMRLPNAIGSFKFIFNDVAE